MVSSYTVVICGRVVQIYRPACPGSSLWLSLTLLGPDTELFDELQQVEKYQDRKKGGKGYVDPRMVGARGWGIWHL